MPDLLEQAITAMVDARRSMQTQLQALERIDEKSDEVLLEAEEIKKSRNVRNARSYTSKTNQMLTELVKVVKHTVDHASVPEAGQKIDPQGWFHLKQDRQHLYGNSVRKLFVVDKAVENVKLTLDNLEPDRPVQEVLERLTKR